MSIQYLGNDAESAVETMLNNLRNLIAIEGNERFLSQGEARNGKLLEQMKFRMMDLLQLLIL